MDKNRMADDKKIEFDYSSPDLVIHRIVSRMPELHRSYGFWIINGDNFYTIISRSYRFINFREADQ